MGNVSMKTCARQRKTGEGVRSVIHSLRAGNNLPHRCSRARNAAGTSRVKASGTASSIRGGPTRQLAIDLAVYCGYPVPPRSTATCPEKGATRHAVEKPECHAGEIRR